MLTGKGGSIHDPFQRVEAIPRRHPAHVLDCRPPRPTFLPNWQPS